MPLNKLDNIIKNVEGRILYVSPSDLDSTDSISNEGNSLTRPFKTLQRALLEAARFSYVRGNSNDEVEKTTILLMPGEHLIDNRPGYSLYKDGNNSVKVKSPDIKLSGNNLVNGIGDASNELPLSLNTNFDLTQKDNDLVKFNSVHGGIIIPRGTSVVGLDLRKTKIRPKYIPNPTDVNALNSAIFRITGACYFWQFSFFDGNESTNVYTNSSDFDDIAIPTFSHHKLTCFEYADGVNEYPVTGANSKLTDLDMYYAKLSYAFGSSADSKEISSSDVYGNNELGFSKQRPEWEIVGAFATDPVEISDIQLTASGSNRVKVTTSIPHNLTENTPIRITGVSPSDYNVSTKVASTEGDNVFYYYLYGQRKNLPVTGTGGKVTIETDTVSGASPYIFNVSMRSVWGMNGMHADGSKASGFRSMVVAQFTGVSLQKDDRAFVKYDITNRTYDSGHDITNRQTGGPLSRDSSIRTTNAQGESRAYHLDSQAIYRKGWDTTHIKISQNAVMQIVSVFAIGYTNHFLAESGGDASVTNSNSNFGQLSLISKGFRNDAFTKDDKGFITNIFTPKSIELKEKQIDWVTIDVGLTTNTYDSADNTSANYDKNKLYLFEFDSLDNVPQILTQGFRIGARNDDKLYLDDTLDPTNPALEATILMTRGGADNTPISASSVSSAKEYRVDGIPSNNEFEIGTHDLFTGEKVLIISDDADLPENIVENTIYYVIRSSTTKIKLASTLSDARSGLPITLYKGTNLKILSRVSDKNAGDIGHPVQFDSVNKKWYITVSGDTTNGNGIWNYLDTNYPSLEDRTEVTYVNRIVDTRSLDEKLYKFRVVIPKQLTNAKNPESGFIIQESSTTTVENLSDFNVSPKLSGTSIANLTTANYLYDRNTRFISKLISGDGTTKTDTITVTTEKPHNLQVNDLINIKNVTDGTNEIAGYAGSNFKVTQIVNSLEFKYETDSNNINVATVDLTEQTRSVDKLARFERKDLQSNLYIYRNETISDYIENQQDGVYHIYVLSSDNTVSEEFDNLKYGQNVVDFYPQLDRDNVNDNPAASKSFAVRNFLGKVVTNDLKNSITRESVDKFVTKIGPGLTIDSVERDSGITTITIDREHGLNGLLNIDGVSGGSFPSNNAFTQKFYNLKIYSDSAANDWTGATADLKVEVDSSGSPTYNEGVVSGTRIKNSGSAITADGSTPYYFDKTVIGATSGNISFTPNADAISNSIGEVVQVTGIGTTSSSYYRIHDVPSSTKIALIHHSSEPEIIPGQYAFINGPSVNISETDGTEYDALTGITLFSCTSAHGLVKGNRFRVIGNDNINLGDFIVESGSVGIKTFTAKTDVNVGTATTIYKHAFSANDVDISDDVDKIDSKGIQFYDNEVATATFSNDKVRLTVPNSGINTDQRFPIGSYIQVNDEIVRIASYTTTSDEYTVIRGSLATKQPSQEHPAGSLVRKIKPIAVEFRRPSIIRASGHTFEYLGYGPGNYSTGLPQLQDRSLNEREEFLVQSQEREGGIVVYTGMNNKGDFFIGNQKKTSTTGEEVSFDTPRPTITGEDPARLSVVFDEVTIKERLVVEGGDRGNVLSQFDGPVTFNEKVIANEVVEFIEDVNFRSSKESTSYIDGAVTISGGVGIAKTLNVNKDINTKSNLNVSSNVTIGGSMFFPDSKLLYFGDENDFGIQHYNHNSYVSNLKADLGDDTEIFSGAPVGVLYLQSYGDGVRIVGDSWNTHKMAGFNTGGSVDLYYNNAKKFETTDAGVNITGITTSSNGINIPEHKWLIFSGERNGENVGHKVSTSDGDPNTNDHSIGLIYRNEDTNDFVIQNYRSNGDDPGNLYLRNVDYPHTANNTNADRYVYIQARHQQHSITCQSNGSVTLYHGKNSDDQVTANGDKKLETIPTGVKVTGELQVTGDITAFWTSSDERLKDNVTAIDDPLAKVLSLGGYTFDWNENSDNEGTDTGVIAQEVESLGLPGMVKLKDNGYKSVQYHKLVPLLIEAIKELSDKVDALEQKLQDK